MNRDDAATRVVLMFGDLATGIAAVEQIRGTAAARQVVGCALLAVAVGLLEGMSAKELHAALQSAIVGRVG